MHTTLGPCLELRMSRAWDVAWRYRKVGDNLPAIGHGVPGPLCVIPTHSVPPVRDLVARYHQITDTKEKTSVCSQPHQRRAFLRCNNVIPAKVLVVLARGGLAKTPWMSTCMVGENHCVQSGVAHRPRMKARNAAIPIGAGPNTAANSPSSLAEPEA